MIATTILKSEQYYVFLNTRSKILKETNMPIQYKYVCQIIEQLMQEHMTPNVTANYRELEQDKTLVKKIKNEINTMITKGVSEFSDIFRQKVIEFVNAQNLIFKKILLYQSKPLQSEKMKSIVDIINKYNDYELCYVASNVMLKQDEYVLDQTAIKRLNYTNALAALAYHLGYDVHLSFDGSNESDFIAFETNVYKFCDELSFKYEKQLESKSSWSTIEFSSVLIASVALIFGSYFIYENNRIEKKSKSTDS